MLAEVDELLAVAKTHIEHGETLAVATTPTLETLFARHLLPAFYEEHPDVAVRVHRARGREEVHAMVLAGEAMLGLSDLPVADGLELVVLGQLEIVVLSSPDSDVPETVPLAALDGMRADPPVARHHAPSGSSTRCSRRST